MFIYKKAAMDYWNIFYFKQLQPSWMEGGVVGHKFQRGPPKDHPSLIWFNLVQWFQRRRFKCESLQSTSDRQMEAKWWPRKIL